MFCADGEDGEGTEKKRWKTWGGEMRGGIKRRKTVGLRCSLGPAVGIELVSLVCVFLA